MERRLSIAFGRAASKLKMKAANRLVPFVVPANCFAFHAERSASMAHWARNHTCRAAAKSAASRIRTVVSLVKAQTCLVGEIAEESNNCESSRVGDPNRCSASKPGKEGGRISVDARQC